MPIRLESPIRYEPDVQSRLQKGLRVARTPAGITLIGTFGAWLLAFLFCRHLFWRDPQSSFFDGENAFKFRYTDRRQQEARQLIQSSERDVNLTQHVASLDPVICAGIISVKRKAAQYLNDTVGSLLVGLTAEERSAVNVQVLFAEPNATKHPDYEQNWLKLVDVWSGYNVSEDQVEEIKKWQRHRDVRAKAIL